MNLERHGILNDLVSQETKRNMHFLKTTASATGAAEDNRYTFEKRLSSFPKRHSKNQTNDIFRDTDQTYSNSFRT